ncbi:MAG: HAMP domain-containing protein [Lachnospiraceae bacterium]|nr:HAMP domain-containing protein [Lachnospiraceae bacterium]
MRKALYFKFILAYLIFAFFGVFMIATFGATMIRNQIVQHEADALYKEAARIANTYASDLYTNRAALDTVKQQLDFLDDYLSSDIWIINPSGLIVLDSSSPIEVENPLKVENFDSTVYAGKFYSVGDFFGFFEEDVLSVYSPITNGYKVQGYVFIHKPMTELQKLTDSMLNISYILLGIFLLLSLIILIFFNEVVYKPLKKITTATEQYAEGNLHYEFTVDSADEMGYLAATLSYMASELAKSEDNQKKLVANVSHDFRSPLTSIKGYSEAMLDGTIPPEMHEKYLTILVNESERLIKLTNNLLTLNNLNIEGLVLDLSVFDINDVIRKTAATFEGNCREKKITLNLILTGDSLPVKADLGKIQQVLYNLLDNAIKFSNRDSEIRITTTEKHNKVFVSVKDFGIGIPKESIGQVFDRFYKTDLSRGKDKKGTGLGLSITREIIRAHGENINVTSTEGEGSEFTFSLPVVYEKDTLLDELMGEDE